MKKLWLIAFLSACNAQDLKSQSVVPEEKQEAKETNKITLKVSKVEIIKGTCDTDGLGQSPQSLTFTEDQNAWDIDYNIGSLSWSPGDQDRVYTADPVCVTVGEINSGCGGYSQSKTTMKVLFEKGEPISAEITQSVLKSKTPGVKDLYSTSAECSATYTK